MRVICIKVPKVWSAYKEFHDIHHPILGETCEVLRAVPHSITREPMYRLKGYTDATFGVENFTSLPDQPIDLEYQHEAVIM